jgi:hypothetical protein
MESGNTGFGFLGFVIWLVFFIPVMWAYVNIVRKAGYSGWNALWLFVPVANVVMFFVFAFSVWPIEQRVAEMERAKAF